MCMGEGGGGGGGGRRGDGRSCRWSPLLLTFSVALVEAVSVSKGLSVHHHHWHRRAHLHQLSLSEGVEAGLGH